MANFRIITLSTLIVLGWRSNSHAQTDSLSKTDFVDVVWLKGDSRLTGTILRWELARGMEFQLATGAILQIPRSEITKVYQDVTPNTALAMGVGSRKIWRPYAFREHGLYQTFSLFVNVADPGGAGLHYSIGHRFNRMLGVGVGLGIESNDFWNDRQMVPVYVEARGFFRPQKISPYYAFKVGYGIALKHNYAEEIAAKGGLMISPEIGIRFGSRAVNYYLGMEYKLQQASYVTTFRWQGDGTTTDKITYKRLELRTGIIF
jgi:hypothetical protein